MSGIKTTQIQGWDKVEARFRRTLYLSVLGVLLGAVGVALGIWNVVAP